MHKNWSLCIYLKKIREITPSEKKNWPYHFFVRCYAYVHILFSMDTWLFINYTGSVLLSYFCLRFLCFVFVSWLSNLSILSVPDEGYSRNALCTLNVMSTLYYYHWVDTTGVELLVPEDITRPIVRQRRSKENGDRNNEQHTETERKHTEN
jgi:hypothetical protein